MGAEITQTGNWKQVRQLDLSPGMIKTIHLAPSWLSLLSSHQDKPSSNPAQSEGVQGRTMFTEMAQLLLTRR
jgi:hypothetical protein